MSKDPKIKDETCHYCKLKIPTEAIVCHHCGRHQKGWRNCIEQFATSAAILAAFGSLVGVYFAHSEKVDAEAALNASREASILGIELAAIHVGVISDYTRMEKGMDSIDEIRNQLIDRSIKLHQLTSFKPTPLTRILTENHSQDEINILFDQWLSKQKSPSVQ